MVSNLKNPLDADLALSYGNKYEVPNYLKKISKYDWGFEEPDNWREYFEKYYSSKSINFFIKGVENGLAGIDGLKGSGAIIFGLIDVLYQNHLEKIMEYDYIIYTRFDQYYFMPLSHKLDDRIYIPEGEDYFGVNDRFIVLPQKSANKYFSICKFIEKDYSERTYEFLNTNSVYYQHIKFLENNFQVIRSSRTMATVATNIDETRWRKAEFNFFLRKNLKLK